MYEELSILQNSKVERELFVQVSADLQRVAAISNHLISTMASFLRWEPEPQVMTVCSFIERPNVNQFNALTSAQMYEDNEKTNIVCRKDHTRPDGVGCYYPFQ